MKVEKRESNQEEEGCVSGAQGCGWEFLPHDPCCSRAQRQTCNSPDKGETSQ